MTGIIFTERRLDNDGVSTVSELLLDGKRLCFTLEPGPYSPAHPRKPSGRFALVLRKEGGIYEKYRAKFPDWFVGIPQIIVPGRSFIEVHMGNTNEDTEGCSLLGAAYERPMVSLSQHYEVRRSQEAYMRVYPQIRDACQAGQCWWETTDEARVA